MDPRAALGLRAAAVTGTDLSRQGLGGTLSLGGWEREHQLAPHLPGPQVEASSPGQDRWLRDYCTSGLYILTLLLEGYGFSEETWPGIEFRKQVTTWPRARVGQGLQGSLPRH